MYRRHARLSYSPGALLCACAIVTFGQSAQAREGPPASASSRLEKSDVQGSREAPLEEARAQHFGLNAEEWARYRELMRGPLGIYSPNLDPLTALGIEARSLEERRHIAELQVRTEARRAERTLAYQRAYDEAWKRLYPSLQPVRADSARAPNPAQSSSDADRVAVFVKENCPPCATRVRDLQAAGRRFDIYVVGTHQKDARIRAWAKSAGIDPPRVRTGQITLNHDAGRWLSIGGQGGLPAVLRAVNGRWQRE